MQTIICPTHIRQVNLIQSHTPLLSGVWLGVDLRTNTKNTYIENKFNKVLKFFSHIDSTIHIIEGHLDD